MISIYTRTNKIFSKERIKWEIKKLFGKKSGPSMVLESLINGLKELEEPFLLNPVRPQGTVHVLSGTEALRDGINWKKENKIKKLIAGPNLVTSPKESDEILLSKEIDIILQPSQWVKDFYLKECPELDQKIKIWHSGSKKIPNQSTRENFCLIYFKNYGEENLNSIIETLKNKKIDFKVLKYGSFAQKEYFDLLKKSSFVIYLSKSESQGLALQEAWIRNVPTLVLESSNWSDHENNWTDDKINAPYQTEDYGYFFNEFNLEEKINLVKNLNPKEKSIMEFSNKASAKLYLNIIK